MVCIYCAGKTKVMNSRPQKRLGQTWRRHECLNCHAIFTTLEAVDYASSLRVRNADGRLTPFSRDKLFLSLHKALGHRSGAISDANALTATIIAQLRTAAQNGLLEHSDVMQATQIVLDRFDRPASVQYAAYHQP